MDKDVKTSGAVNGAAVPHKVGKAPKAQQTPGDASKNTTSKMKWTGGKK